MNSAVNPSRSKTTPTPAPSNSALLLDARYADLVVRAAPYTAPGAHEIVIRNRAIAVNPLDEIKQSTGDLMYRWLPYPAVLGEDVAGEVVEVGSAVTRFQPGDRAIGYAVGMEKGRNHQAEGAFQLFTVVQGNLASPIPDAMSFEDAVVLPLAVSTAASALFGRDQLGLRHPTTPAGAGAQGDSTAPNGAGAHGDSSAQGDSRQSADSGTLGDARQPADSGALAGSRTETVVVWGGSTSVGSNAIQLARAAGYAVISTASPRNHDYVLGLGAARVFDYGSPTVVKDIIEAIAGAPVAGVFAVGTGSAEPAVAIAAATGAKRVSLATPSVSLARLPRRAGPSLELMRVGLGMLASNVALQARSRSRGIKANYVWGSTLMNDEVGPMLWRDFLPAALADGRFVAAPRPQVVGSGLEHVQAALDLLRQGVSARKLVVLL
ncbi:hypothetical protein GCM10011399_22140 [Subtercola lobariae]|uniref:Enoyl reductase (ER) domain-containing protein n=2 Tax=Subtercola lobariae TaxID=1588641 RepID=A0A917BAR1_9MICO|nr:hypothetical protein GCM10011399_22140 [Subtercola lobariae]